jgi:aspartyl/asparaginyl beta-hydroxylase (cupin superfamily)
MRGPISRAINRFAVRHLVPLTQVPNLPGDPVGLGNRLFAALRPLRTALQATKRTSTPLYYILKLGAAAALVAWLVLMCLA